MDYNEFAAKHNPDKTLTIYFKPDSNSYRFYGAFVVGKLFLPRVSDGSFELAANYLPVRISADLSKNEHLNALQIAYLREHGVQFRNIDLERTLDVRE